jgi:hypothetical protein
MSKQKRLDQILISELIVFPVILLFFFFFPFFKEQKGQNILLY